MEKTVIRYVSKIFFASIIVVLASFSWLIAFSGGPIAQVTGAPGENTCNQSGCHTGTPVNGGSGTFIVSGLPDDGYVPGATHTISFAFSGTGRSTFGFEAVALTDGGTSVGTFAPISGTQLITGGGKTYIQHNTPSSTGVWNIDWTAPTTDVGRITIYVAGNAANGDNSTFGDWIFTSFDSKTADVQTSVDDEDAFTPNQFRLHRNYPNPFNPVTTIRYELASPGVVSLRIYDILGREVRALVNDQQGTGSYSVVWDGRDTIGRQVASGTYIARLRAGSKVAMVKMLMIK